ncbi:hypothetical protein C5C39_02495 [Rathayibacter sp. AY1F3]|uniref:SIR2 family protein n=1 Tax=Rathayibacter sp. AY1F3 TaxID=2080558 RepID=UPI000CE92A66|nr:SIR2 family protein [Rathayibacter sp. AY1F3]PPG92896.1 hypothetical protein C5C39_02495 [Rathayibacter sp. AY1F3]
MHEWIRPRSTVALLGAGASAPSLPVSTELTALVIARLSASLSGDRYIDRLWRAMRDQLMSQETQNIEEFYTAIADVPHRLSDPTRLWVSQWAELPEPSAEEDVTFDQSVDFLASSVEQFVMMILAERTEAADPSYLLPLLNSRPQAVVTLNYDLMIEKAAREGGLRIATGAELWDGGFRWFNDDLPAEAVPILKPHGSLNWRRVAPFSTGGLLADQRLEEVGGDGTGPARSLPRVDPTLIFGKGNKLTPYGPFGSLYREWETQLERAETLVVIGFSFNDSHITGTITRWAATNTSARIIIIDPFLDLTGTTQRTDLERLLYQLWDPYEGGRPTAADRLRVLRKSSAEGIADVFG